MRLSSRAGLAFSGSAAGGAMKRLAWPTSNQRGCPSTPPSLPTAGGRVGRRCCGRIARDAAPNCDFGKSGRQRITPPPLIESLPLLKDRGRIVVSGTMALPGYEGVWACGDCAARPDDLGKPYPTTAQHAIRQGA